MALHVRWSRAPARDLKALAPEIQLRVIQKVLAAAADPRRHLVRLKGVRGFRLRVGDWRVLVDVDDAAEALDVVAVGHRRNAYG